MRLGQLARKLSLRPSQLVDFLAARNIETEEGSNARLDDSHVEIIVQYFAPESLNEILKVTVAEEAIEIEKPKEEVIIPEQEQEAIQEEPIVKVLVPEPEITDEEREVIRVQKIELAGLKVLGKIELPEPKKKEPQPDDESNSAETTEAKPEYKERKLRPVSKPKHQNRDREQRAWRNPLEVQRQREARDDEDKRKAEIEREKEKRKKHYQNKVKAPIQPKRAKPVKETTVIKKAVDTRPVPKTWLGKFFRWWTT